jgi:two-component system phosphate regulon sensor histidine kinase PhoR
VKKNTSPRSVAFIAGLLAAVLSTLIIAIASRDILISVINFAVVLGICYLVFNYLLQEFVYNKIKLIYKSIYRFKTHNPKELKALDKNINDPIETVSKEVLAWMLENRKEIDQLQKQENFRREFLGNVSHELKTPIQSIQGYIHTLLDGALEDKKVNRLFLTKASKSTERLIELVDELTSISELEGDKSPLDIELFDLVKLTEEVLEMVENLAKDKNVAIHFKKQNPKIVIVEADKSKIRQVLVNLVVNAIKYGKSGGQILIGYYDMDKNILTEISDDGEGIAEEHLPRLFERFYRTDSGRSRDQGGSGLGLAIVKHIIEAHKQTINVRSTLGVGSTFGFTLKKG